MEIHFEIENKCLLECRHCSSYATNMGDTKNYCLDDIKNFLKLFEEEKYVFFTGGEPLVHCQIDEILHVLNSEIENITLGIFTTGILEQDGQLYPISKEYAKRLAERGLKICYFSIYSSCAEKHDWMTKKQGSYDLSIESMRNVAAEDIEVKINLVITKKNCKEIDNIIELASSLNCTEVRLLKLIRHGRACECWEDIGLTEQEYRRIVLEVINKYSGIKITASSCPDILPCRPSTNAEGCQAGSNLAYITYEGEVFPCASAKNNKYYKIGNLNELRVVHNYFENINCINQGILCNTIG